MIFGKSKYHQSTDEELLGLFQEKPMAAIEEFYKRYSVLCYGLALKYLKNRQEAKDAVSDIFIRLRFDLEKHEVNSFRSWFYMYSKNHCLGIIRKRKKPLEIEAQWQADYFSDDSKPEFKELEFQNLEQAINQLSSDQARCLRAFYFQKKSYEEIAQIFKISVKRVKSNLQNGKRNLRLKLETQSKSILRNK